MSGSQQQAGTGHTQRMAQRDGTTVRVDPGIIIGEPQVPGTGQRLGGKGFVELEYVDFIQRYTGALKQLAHRRYRTVAHDARLDTSRGHAENLRHGYQAVFLHCGLARHQHSSRAIIDSRGVAGSDAAPFAEGGGQTGQLLQASLSQVFILIENQWLLLAPRDLDRGNFAGKTTRLLSGSSLLLGAQGKDVLIFP